MYEIPIEDEIPQKINDYTLILISRGKLFDYFDLDNNYLYSKPIFIEQPNHELYNVEFESEQLKKYWEYMKDYQVKNNLTNVEKKYIVNFESSIFQFRYNGQSVYEHLTWAGQEIEIIDNIEYISIKYSLTDRYEYFIDGEYIYYKLSDIISFIKEHNK